MIHGGEIYDKKIEYDFSVNMNPLDCKEVYSEISGRSMDRWGQYPDMNQTEFRKAVAKIEQVSAGEVYGGNGASEIFVSLVNCLKPQNAILINPCFSGYHRALLTRDACEIHTIDTRREECFCVNEEVLCSIREEMKQGGDLLILTNPNNPTGRALPKEYLEKIIDLCREYHTKLIVDECFLRMSENVTSAVSYIHVYDGLYVVNAFTKLFSLPGIRVGYVVSAQENIERLSAFFPEWNLSVIAQEAGVVCEEYIRNQNWIGRTVEKISTERTYMMNQLAQLGYEVFESDTSFFLIYSKDDALNDYLMEHRVMIRDCSNFEGLERGFYRIGIKDRKANEVLLNLLRERVKTDGTGTCIAPGY